MSKYFNKWSEIPKGGKILFIISIIFIMCISTILLIGYIGGTFGWIMLLLIVTQIFIGIGPLLKTDGTDSKEK